MTNVWTQSIDISHKLARSAYIEKVSKNILEMIPEVDAVLLARDDSENHFKFAEQFLKAGLPIFIDKPLATSLSKANEILSLEKYPGQIFSCSACRYAREFELTYDRLEEIGHIKKIVGYTPNSWEKYSVYLIEPILKYIPISSVIENKKVIKNSKFHTLKLKYNNDLCVEMHCVKSKNQPIELKFIGEKRHSVTWRDTFSHLKSLFKHL